VKLVPESQDNDVLICPDDIAASVEEGAELEADGLCLLVDRAPLLSGCGEGGLYRG
jgi:hypothetical protein